MKIKDLTNRFCTEFWKQTTTQISNNEVLEIGGVIISLLIFGGIIITLNCLDIIHIF